MGCAWLKERHFAGRRVQDWKNWNIEKTCKIQNSMNGGFRDAKTLCFLHRQCRQRQVKPKMLRIRVSKCQTPRFWEVRNNKTQIARKKIARTVIRTSKGDQRSISLMRWRERFEWPLQSIPNPAWRSIRCVRSGFRWFRFWLRSMGVNDKQTKRVNETVGCELGHVLFLVKIWVLPQTGLRIENAKPKWSENEMVKTRSVLKREGVIE